MRVPVPMFPRRVFPPLGPLALLGMLAGASAPLSAQAPQLFRACYVPLTGSMYRIKTPDTKPACSSTSHIEFSWTDGLNALRSGDAAGGDLSSTYPNPRVVGLQGRSVSSAAPSSGQVLSFDGTSWAPATPPSGGTSDHGALSGLADDDHPQYLLGNGVRNYTNGFAVTGTSGIGGIATSGAGTRLLWYPRKAAFRVGQVDAGQWDDVNIGSRSLAMGFNTTASGFLSTAMGNSTTATGDASTAMGFNTTASGFLSTAMGNSTTASGNNSTAMGRLASTNGHAGSFVYGDNSSANFNVVNATAPNQFVVRAAGGTTFFSNSGLTAGVTLAPGAGAWTTVSDVNRKHLFRDEDGEAVLEKIARLPIRSWGYLSQDVGIRHLGPTAQDFHAAFGLGESELGITTTDIDGVNLLAVQALERRTAEQERAIGRLQAENAELRLRLKRLEAVVAR